MPIHPSPFERALERVLNSNIPNEVLHRNVTASKLESIFSKDCELVTTQMALFLAMTLNHKIGSKKGSAFLPGTLRGIGRKDRNVDAIFAMVLDADEEANIDDVRHRLNQLDWVHSIYTSYSDGKTTTTIKVVDLVLKVGLADENDISVELLERYLRECKGYDAVICSTIVGFKLTCDKKGERVIQIEHGPIRKFRVVIPLEESFAPSRYRSLAEAKRAWAGFLEAVAQALELKFDRACVDLSRAFFLPRHAKGRPFETFVGGTRLLDLTEVEPIKQRDVGKRSAAVPSKPRTPNHSIATDPDRKKVSKLLAQMGHNLDLIELLVDRIGWETRGDVKDCKVAILCPNNDQHSTADDTSDAGCVIMNPDAADCRRAVIACQHAHCRDLRTADFLTMVFQQVDI